ncbi:MAG: site-specific DNA-methyltransferase, partial [Malacoplasma sp.]
MNTTNLSKIKRDKMLKTINEIKISITDENILKNLSMIENELTKKKYGLIWEEHEERVDKELETKIPTFEEIKENEILLNKEEKINFLLEGDNLHCLYLLEKTHKGKVDVIYIDPPYNTGKEFIYNDNTIDENDGYRHSKWLSFMSRRLNLAKNLLSEKGVIFLSIDDYEHSQLKILCDEIFDEGNFIADFAVIRAEGGGLAKQVIKGHDYALVYVKNIKKFKPLAKEKDIRGKIVTRNNVEYWIQEDWLRKEFGKYGNCHYEELAKYKDLKTIEEIESGLKNGKYELLKKDNGMHIIGKLRRLDEDSSKFYSILKHLNKNGVLELKKFNLEVSFDYPKPVSLIQELIKGATFFSKMESPIILDFFAGSGTTAQAVLNQNKLDGGNRKFILCTNNDNNICSSITYPRIKQCILGNKEIEANSANLKYYKTSYISRINTETENLHDNLLINIKNLIQ